MPDGVLPECCEVRIVRLHQQGRDYGNFGQDDGVFRPPQVGDTGAIVHIYDPTDPATAYIVENVNQDGYTIWLADFTADELEQRDPHRS